MKKRGLKQRCQVGGDVCARCGAGLKAGKLLSGTVLGTGSWMRQLPVTEAQESRAGHGSREFLHVHTRQNLTSHSHGNPSLAVSQGGR